MLKEYTPMHIDQRSMLKKKNHIKYGAANKNVLVNST